MGWMGWTEEQTLRTTIPALELAFEGRCDMLAAIFGGAETPAKKPVSARPFSFALFDAQFGGDA